MIGMITHKRRKQEEKASREMTLSYDIVIARDMPRIIFLQLIQ